MKKELTYLLLFIAIPILAQINNQMNYKLIKSSELELRNYKSIKQIEYNLAVIFLRPQGDYIIFPQKGVYSIIVDSEYELQNIIDNRLFPLLDDNKSLYMNLINIVVEDGKIVNASSLQNQIVTKLEASEDIISENYILYLEEKLLKLQKKDKEELFSSLLFFFGEYFKNKLHICWVTEKEFYFYPIVIPLLYDEELNISLFNLNEKLEEQIVKNKINLKKLLIEIYCNYFHKRFLSTNQLNYFDAKSYKNVLKKDFDKYWKFPFVDIWNTKKG